MTARNQTPIRPPVVVLTGAGVSTDSGIPDFRSPGGLWERFDPMSFSIERFHAGPARFWRRRAELITAARYLDADPNTAHHILAQAVRDGRIATLVTQNVDGLHAKAGTPLERLIEVHGNGAWCVCLGCGAREGTQEVLDSLVHLDPATPPTCARAHCGGLLKPDVVLFGEPVTTLPDAAAAVAACRTLVVAGTSLQVHPVAGLAGLAVQVGAELVVCNREPTPYDDLAKAVHRDPVAQSLARLFPPLPGQTDSSITL